MSDLEDRLSAWNDRAAERINALRERAESRRLARDFLDGLAELARELWHDVGKEALGAAARGLLADAIDKLEER